MTAFPVSDFARESGIEFSRESATANARAKTRADVTQAADRSEPHDVREDRTNNFDAALRAQETDEPSRPSRIDRPKDAAASAPAPSDEVESTAPVDSKSSAATPPVKSKPAAEEPAPQAMAKPSVLLPEAVLVVSAATPVIKAAAPDAGADLASESSAEAVEADPGAVGVAIPVVVAPDSAALTQAQNLLAALGAAPAPQNTQQHAAAADDAGFAAPAPAADPLAALKAAQSGQNASSPAQGAEQAAASATKPGAPAQPIAAFEAAAAATPTPGGKPETALRQASDKTAKTPDAAAPNAAATPAATAQNTAQPAAAVQSANKAAEAQAPKGANAADAQTADIKATATAQPSSFAGLLDSQSSQLATPASAAAPGQTSANSTAIAHNVVRFFRETGAGSARFDIRLDPVELGRVDARVEINPDKTVTLTLSAERPETLAELMRTARDLERQLADSGVKLSDDGLKFRLNSDARGDAQQNMQGGSEGRRPARGAYAAGAESALQAEAAIPIRSWRASGVDVWA